jgi:hypothetical protein
MSCGAADKSTPHVPDEAPGRLPQAPPAPTAKDAPDNDTAPDRLAITLLLNRRPVLQWVADVLQARVAEADLEKARDKAALLRLKYDLNERA